MPPGSTYRVQLHAGFGFADAAGIAHYLAELGVTHLYCSPYLQAAPGSTHGYDVVDPRQLNAELGGARAHAEMTGALRSHGLGQVLDIVPNHMATDAANDFWWDVLENGPASRYARFFDIDWDGGGQLAPGKSAFTVLVPILGDHYGRVLEAGEIRVTQERARLVVRYFDHRLPVSPRTLDELLARAARRAGSAPLASLAEASAALPPARLSDPAAVAERHARKVALLAELASLTERAPTAAGALTAELAALNADIDRLDALLRRQNYRLAHWRTASEELDYRRFFNIESLVGVREEDPEVFDVMHGLILELVADGTVTGLRVDHVDGLRDPEGYLTRLAERTGGAYTVVEKILGAAERTPATWPVAGTSGYDFVTRVNNVFVARAQGQAMTDAYTSFTGDSGTYADVVHAAKLQVMGDELVAEVERMTDSLAELCDADRRHRDHTRRDLRAALREVVAHFPVYRTYFTPGRATAAADRGYVSAAVEAAIAHVPHLDAELVRFIGELALGQRGGAAGTDFALRFQQLTAPVMAKGVEDTAFYRYHRLISLNEVGGDPGTFGWAPEAFHAETQTAAVEWPDAMLTLSTHDTKRSADVRARLNVLSQIPAAWSSAAGRWSETNEHHRGEWDDGNVEYLLYQTLVGAWPLEVDRCVAFLTKAVREAKVHTSWADPNEAYEAGLERFVRALYADEAFVSDLQRFLHHERVVDLGRRNSLAQTALLLTCPGVPDLYQGSELWDLSLVDPDNRRPVDYPLRRRLLTELADAKPGDALTSGEAGQAKLWLVHRLLHYRAANPDLFAGSVYAPLALTGPRSRDAVAFHRGALAVVVPRFGTGSWEGTGVELPAGAWTSVLTGESVDGGTAGMAQLLRAFPVAVLARHRS